MCKKNYVPFAPKKTINSALDDMDNNEKMKTKLTTNFQFSETVFIDIYITTHTHIQTLCT